MSQYANFQVFQASAGSGKTYTIVKEYLKLCLKSDKHLDNFRHILAITFTNASANDMKAKIVGYLLDIANSETGKMGSMGSDLMAELDLDESDLKHNAQLLLTRIIHDYSSFCVSTIDAFVQKLSRAFAHDLGLPGQYTVSIDTDEIAETITGNIGMQISDENKFLVQLLLDFSENRFTNQQSNNLEYQLNVFVEKLMSEKAYQKDENNNIKNLPQYKQTLDFLKDKTESVEKEIKSYVDLFYAIVKRYNLELEDFAYGRNGFIAYLDKLSNRLFEMPSQRFKNVVETGKWYSAEAKKRFLPNELECVAADMQDVLRPLLDCCNKHLASYLFYKSQSDLLYLYALRTVIREEFNRLAQEDEVVHISEFNKLLNTVMGDFTVPFVYERIGEHFYHVFVDEFQDTSVLQWQNLLPLIDNGLSAGKMSMVVGDGKQSIYRFRSGEVEQIVQLPEIYALPEDERKSAFLQFQQNLKDCFSFHKLDSNYRSFSNLVLFNSDFFEVSMKRLSSYFQKVYHDEDNLYGKSVSVVQQPKRKERGLVQLELYNADNQPDYCLQRIAALISELTEEKNYRLADITILVRNSKLGSEIANFLNDKQIPVISRDSIVLKTSNKVQLLVNTLRFLIHHDNEVVVANVLYFRRLTQQPAFDGSLGNLFENVKPVIKGTIPIETALGIDQDVLANALAKSTCIYDLCCSLIRIYNLDALHDAFLNYFLEEVFAFQNSSKEGIAEFLSYWEKKQDVLAVKSVSGNAVNITTIHKSKGLEFKVVIYPEAITDLDEKQKTTPAEAWIMSEKLGFESIPNLEKVLFKLDKTAGTMGEKPGAVVEKEKESNQLDNLNLLYVAFTRAKQRLYVLAKQTKSDKPNLFYNFLKETKLIIDKVSEDDGVTIYRYGDPDFINPDSDEKAESVIGKPIDSVSADWFQRINVDSDPSMFWISPKDMMQPREWGEMVHQILSGIRSEKDIDAAFEPYLLEGVIDARIADVLKDRFLQMAHHPMLSAAFGVDAKVKNECEILSDGDILRPDRYAELPNVIYLLDYKTGKKDKEHHRQLKRYIAALQSMVEKEICAYLVYLSDPIELDRVIMDTLF